MTWLKKQREGSIKRLLMIAAIVVGGLWHTQSLQAQTFEFRVGANGADGTSGNGSGEFNFPLGIVADAGGQIYVADLNNHRIQILDSTGAFIQQIGSGVSGNTQGTYATTQFSNPQGVAVDGSCNIWIGDGSNHQIVRCDNINTCSLFAGDGTAGSTDGAAGAARFNLPRDVTLDGLGNLWISDQGNHTIRSCNVVSADCITRAGIAPFPSFDDGPLGISLLNSPAQLSFAPTGVLYFADEDNNVVRTLDPTTNFVVTVIGGGPGQPGNNQLGGFNARLDQPRGLAVDDNGKIYVADTDNRRIAIYLSDTSFSQEFGTVGTGYSEFNGPQGIFVDSQRIYVSGSRNHRIQVFSRDDATGATPDISPDPGTVAFGDVILNDDMQVNVQVSNLGDANLNIGSVGGTDGLAAPFSFFGINTCTSAVVVPLSDCDVEVVFQPTATGMFMDSFNIPSNDPDTPDLTIDVTGTGVEIPTVGGTATGLTIKTVKCKIKGPPKEKVKIEINGSSNSWDCEAAGLVVSPGDQIAMTVKGTVN